MDVSAKVDATASASNNELLDTFHMVFSRKNLNDIDESTGLGLNNSLNYSLKTCLLLEDDKWLLGILDIDNLKNINDKIGYKDANIKIITLGRIIKEFCDEKPLKTKGFRYNNIENNKADMFAILIRYSKKISNIERRLKTLMNKINNILNITISIGLSKMNINDNNSFNFQEWINKSIKFMLNVQNSGGNDIYSDIYGDISDDNNDLTITTNTNGNNSESNKDSDLERDEISYKLGNEVLFESKGKEIAMKEDPNWILALIDADNMGLYFFILFVLFIVFERLCNWNFCK